MLTSEHETYLTEINSGRPLLSVDNAGGGYGYVNVDGMLLHIINGKTQRLPFTFVRVID